ncbi:MAG: amidohydrolase, partial [Fusobacterium sp. JB021]|nr:amidohydrolase [Fusobacterium sp. JB021]
MTKEELKQQVLKVIEENKDLIINIGRDIYKNPEYGYKEFETTKKVANFLKNELNLETSENIAYTGCRARLNSEKKGPKVAILGELDGISCNEHVDALENGASHTCGHNIQIAGMLGAAVGLIKSGVYKHLDGKIDFMATPAEEFVQLEYRSKLKEEGKIKFFGGKQELIRKGAFDDVNMSIMFHAQALDDKKVLVGPVSNGFIGKQIKFIGKEAHAGSAPYEGINALNAAMLAINNVNAQRETFKEAD